MAELSVMDATPAEIEAGMEAWFGRIMEKARSAVGGGDSMAMEFLEEAMECLREGYRSLDRAGQGNPKRAEALQDCMEMQRPAIRSAMSALRESWDAAGQVGDDGESMDLPGEVFESTERLCDSIRDAGNRLRHASEAILEEERGMADDAGRIRNTAEGILASMHDATEEAKKDIGEKVGSVLAAQSLMEPIREMLRDNGERCKPYQMRQVYEVYRSSVRNVADRLERIAQWNRRAMERQDFEAWAFARNSLAETAEQAEKYFDAIHRELGGRYRDGKALSGSLLEIPAHGDYRAHDPTKAIFVQASRRTAATGQDFSKSIAQACLQHNVSMDGAFKMLDGIRKELGLGMEQMARSQRPAMQAAAR